MQGILFDIDGVIYSADHPVPGAAEAIAALKSQGVPRRFLTNTSTLSRGDLTQRLRQFGVEVEEDEIIHPPSATAAYLKHVEAQQVALFVAPSAEQDFAGVPLLPKESESGADFVVVGDMSEAWNFTELNRAFRLLHSNPQATLVALGMTRYWQGPDGLRLDVAPFVVALEHAIERKAVVLGKPALPFFEMALASIGLPATEVLMVGDDVRGDVGGAQAAGMSGMLVRTGKYRAGDLQRGVIPDAVLDSVADLPEWWTNYSNG